jgi:hypothetical protein
MKPGSVSDSAAMRVMTLPSRPRSPRRKATRAARMTPAASMRGTRPVRSSGEVSIGSLSAAKKRELISKWRARPSFRAWMGSSKISMRLAAIASVARDT